jgi:isoaspartyl peptidase/L-asparaginase-like protein (Ntn-hydrolase superfamily)
MAPTRIQRRCDHRRHVMFENAGSVELARQHGISKIYCTSMAKLIRYEQERARKKSEYRKVPVRQCSFS